MNQALRERLNTLYAAIKLGQFDFVLNALDDDVEFISYSPIEIFPFLGHRRGKAAMAEALRAAHEAFDFVTYEPISMVLESDNVAVQIFVRVVDRKTGRSLQLVIAEFLRLHQGKIVEIRQFMDSFRAAEQALGRQLVVAEA